MNEIARRPPKPPTGGQAATAQLIVVSIGAAGKARSSVTEKCRGRYAIEVSRSSDLSEEMNEVARRPPKPPPAAKR